MTVKRADSLRQAIGIARVLGILGIIYVHAWTGRTAEELAILDQSPQGVLRWALIEMVGYSAVPLLGIISGWLAGPSSARRSYRDFVAVKARTILLPMLLWNAITMAVVVGLAVWAGLAAPVPKNLAETLDWWLCLTQPNPINVQIAFLRDLFVCMTIAPLLARLRDGWLVALLLLTVAWAITAYAFPLLLRPQILSFFLIGMLARRHDLIERIARWRLITCVTPYLVMVPMLVWLTSSDDVWLRGHLHRTNTVDLVMRVSAALALCRVSMALAPTRAGAFILKGEHYAFLLFCCHMLLIWCGGPVIGLWTGPLGSPLYPALLIAEPILVFLPTILIGRTLEAVSPALANVLSGGRLAAPKGRAPLPRSAASVKEPANSPPGAAS
ncbi:acyltransferase family protein [Sphingomonas sp. PR090111-T3T-6A]|uniref:acyltransferase family protein n=1 Tax=Sphingomonas sp. PR090111-T3T-6A TaxID=685778 RepID=UPI000374C16A|nr:acyltransferase [Sphingomonas sp. PR090111-T3T-6A]